MKQVLQSLRSGETWAENVPYPSLKPGHLLVQTRKTLVSVGTERMLVDFGRSNFVQKARKQPDKVRMVLDKVRTDGLAPTLEAVFNKLDQPLPLGYCNVGTVLEFDPALEGLEKGMRVVSNGAHAQAVRVPLNLSARVPDQVSDEEAAFTVLGAVALEGVRLIQPTLGETVVVTGLGLIGLVTVQLLRAHGCRVIGLDYDSSRVELAKAMGADAIDLSTGQDPVAASKAFAKGRGVDAVIITASTDSSEPVKQAANMCRIRGRVVLVGVTGLELSRNDFYEKELSFQVSCSYGPGRYDSNYEELGQDYPIGYVRWTAQRNFEAVLDMMADGRLDVKPLISHRFAIDEAAKAYEVVAGSEPSMGILLDYPSLASDEVSSDLIRERTVSIHSSASPALGNDPSVSFIGAGNYAGAILIPAFKQAGAALRTIASSGGVSGVHNGKKFGFAQTSTDVDTLFSDTNTQIVTIATRHDSHADYVLRAIEAGKHVFVEKPLCLEVSELTKIEEAAKQYNGRLMVGFNRRFAPLVEKAATLLRSRSAASAFVYTVNAGAIPATHWAHDEQAGGGRILGEACHFIDLLRFLAGSPIIGSHIDYMSAETNDTACIQLRFANGSIGSINYLANGSKSFPKERIEIFSGGGILQIDNFRKLSCFGWDGAGNHRLWRQDKGQNACVAAFVKSIKEGTQAPIPLDEILEVSRVSIELGRTKQR